MVSPGVIVDQDLIGISVAGSGQMIAMGSLMANSPAGLGDLESTIYRLLEAKFASEVASGVGRATTVMTFSKDDKYSFMSPLDVQRIREIWNALREEPIDQSYEAPFPAKSSSRSAKERLR